MRRVGTTLMRASRRSSPNARRWAFEAGLIAVAAAFLAPQVWLFSLSLKTKAGVYEFPPRWLPADPSLASYRFALGATQVPWYLWNSAVVAIAATIGTMVVAAPAAYVISRERFRDRDRLLAWLLLVQMLSPVVLLVPIYRMVEG